MSLRSARAFHILLSVAMKSLLLILAVLAFDLKLAFGGPSGKFYMNIISAELVCEPRISGRC